jgi:hypothetical protein
MEVTPNTPRTNTRLMRSCASARAHDISMLMLERCAG